MAAVAVAAARRAGLAAWAAPAVTRLPDVDPDVAALKASTKQAAVGLLQEREHTHWVLEVGREEAGGAEAKAGAKAGQQTTKGPAPPASPEAPLPNAPFVDVATGHPLSISSLRAMHPYYVPTSSLDPPARPRLWRGTARLSVEGFQRRGEADDVAKWVYITLALDANAAEWTSMLGADA